MGYYRDKEFYNDVFTRYKKYHTGWSQSDYLPLWEKVIERLKALEPGRILEVGSGPGQFAAMLFDHGFTNYIGFDFSEKGVEHARRQSDQEFYIADARKITSYTSKYDIMICLEVLEHTDDLTILGNLRPGTKIIFTVPDFDDRAHLRHFKSVEEVVERYKDSMFIDNVTYFDRFFIVTGTKE